MAKKKRSATTRATIKPSRATVRRIESALARLAGETRTRPVGRFSASRLAKIAGVSRATLYRVPGIVERLTVIRDGQRGTRLSGAMAPAGAARKRDDELKRLRGEAKALRVERDTLAQYIQTLTLQLARERAAVKPKQSGRSRILPLIPRNK